MRNETRKLFNAYLDQVAKLNGVDSATTKFAIEPSVQQKLEQRMQESSEFLGQIGMIGVDELIGEKVGIGVSGTIASRTDTTGSGVRTPREVQAVDNQKYEAKQTDFDTAIRYSLLDAWAKFPEFQALLRDAIIKRQALDRIMIGFNGTSAAATTNRSTNPCCRTSTSAGCSSIATTPRSASSRTARPPARSSSATAPLPTTTTSTPWCSTRWPT